MAPRKKQQRRKDVPLDHHLARYCNHQVVRYHATTGALEGVFPAAFALRRDKKENYLSVQWMESFSANVDSQFIGSLMALKKKLAKIGSNSAIARVHVSSLMEEAKIRSHQLRVKDRSSSSEKGYAGVYGLPLDNSDLEFLALLADKCCTEVRRTSDIDALAIASPTLIP